MKKKVLTLDDLYSFFEQRNQTTVFSAKESGYNIAVQVPAKFELEDSDEDDGFLRTKFKVNHLYENRNNSNNIFSKSSILIIRENFPLWSSLISSSSNCIAFISVLAL